MEVRGPSPIRELCEEGRGQTAGPNSRREELEFCAVHGGDWGRLQIPENMHRVKTKQKETNPSIFRSLFDTPSSPHYALSTVLGSEDLQ